jgi:hypothetical protein
VHRLGESDFRRQFRHSQTVRSDKVAAHQRDDVTDCNLVGDRLRAAVAAMLAQSDEVLTTFIGGAQNREAQAPKPVPA